MNLRLATSAPFPWLNTITGIFYGKRAAKANGQGERASQGVTPLLRLPRSISVTREGKWFIGVLLLIGVAAINTGNNLLYLIVAAMLSFIIISGVLSESTMGGIKILRQLPNHIFKGRPAGIIYKIENSKKRLPSYSFSVTELPSSGLKADPAYVLKLKAREETVIASQCVFERRGMFALKGVRISTRFPFGIFLKGRKESAVADVTVYPAVTPVSSARLETISRNANSTDRELMAFAKGNGTELRSMRDYVFGEDARFIYWKSAAKRQKLLVKEFEKETERKVMVLFDNYSAKDSDPAFEDMVDETAGVISHFIEHGFSVGLKTLVNEASPAPGSAQLFKLLKTLAVMTSVKENRDARLMVVYL